MGPLGRYLYTDLKSWMVDSILAKVDAMSMAHSLEVRVPYLNPRFVEIAASIPDSYKLRGWSPKYIFKKAALGQVPSSVIKRKKAGFNIPIGQWLRAELKGLMVDTLTSSYVEQVGFLNKAYVQQLMKEHLTSKKDHGFKLLSLLHFCLWHNKFIKSNPVLMET